MRKNAHSRKIVTFEELLRACLYEQEALRRVSVISAPWFCFPRQIADIAAFPAVLLPRQLLWALRSPGPVPPGGSKAS